jgi:hypothetical protein
MITDSIKVKWLKAHWDFAYSEGDIGHVTAAHAAMLLKGGYIIPLPDEPEGEVNPLPADLPGREILFNAGFKTLDEVKSAGASLTDVGISNTTIKKIMAYLNK